MTKPKRGYAIRSFLTFMTLHKWRFGVTMLVFAVSNVMIALIPLYIGKLVGNLSIHPVQGHQAVIDVWILIGLSTGHNVLWRFAEYLYAKYVSSLSFEYESILFRLIIRKPYPYFVDKFTGKVASYITNLTQEQRGFFDELCYNYVNLVVSLAAMLIILASVNWQTGVIFIVGVVALFVIGRFTVHGSTKAEKQLADVQSTKNAKIIDAIANFVNVKSFRKEAIEIKAIDAEEVIAKKAMKHSLIKAIWFWGSMSVIVRDVIWPATIGLNVYLFLHGSLSLGQLSVVLSTVLIFTSVVWDGVWYISQLNLRFARIEEAHHYLFGDVNIVKLHRSMAIPPEPVATFHHSLELYDLTFAYPDKPDMSVLRNLNLRIKRGQKVGIVGKSGSGKSTLTKLLLGYYDIPVGSILLDNQPVGTHETANTIAYVPQDTSLFHRSIADNIAYAASRPVTRDEIVKAAKLAHAHEFIDKVNDGYDALVGERGVKLSVGQRQRIAIARALLDDKQLLILDEATSALDSESEVLVQEALENLWDSKTVIAIAHRLSTLRHMDIILVMDNGQIIEQGSHNELLAKKGTYAKLWAHQSGGFIEE
jgi:ATP-binding cassette, subfamily B, bacterial